MSDQHQRTRTPSIVLLSKAIRLEHRAGIPTSALTFSMRPGCTGSGTARNRPSSLQHRRTTSHKGRSMPKWRDQCQSTSQRGSQCIYNDGHTGSHRAVGESWKDRACPRCGVDEHAFQQALEERDHTIQELRDLLAAGKHNDEPEMSDV